LAGEPPVRTVRVHPRLLLPPPFLGEAGEGTSLRGFAGARQRASAPRRGFERLVAPRDRRAELVRVARLDDDLDLARAVCEARVRADEHARVPLAGLLQDSDDTALAGAVAASPRPDRPLGAQLVLELEEHRLHLRRQAGHDVDVLEDEAGR